MQSRTPNKELIKIKSMKNDRLKITKKNVLFKDSPRLTLCHNVEININDLQKSISNPKVQLQNTELCSYI